MFFFVRFGPPAFLDNQLENNLDAKQFSEMLNGRNYGNELDNREEELAKSHGLVIVYGASDDLIEFRGAIYDEGDCYNGGEFFVNRGGIQSDEHHCDCDFCGWDKIVDTSKKIEAVWSDEVDGPSWTYKTEIPHETFEIMEDGFPYCVGIVFHVDSLD